MDSDWEIIKWDFGHYCLRRKSDKLNDGIYFRKCEVSDIVHQLMFYLPSDEGF